MSTADQLKRGLIALGLVLDNETQQRLLDYIALIEKWNRVYNLTAIREPEKIVSHHLLDSLAVAPHLHAKCLLDVGSGAGLPGIPLALANPEMQVTLLDSNHKKIAFLNQAVMELKLKNAKVSAERVESWQTQNRFDVIISRAFSEMSEFVRITRHLLAPGGMFAAMKGLHPYEEIDKLPSDCKVRQVLPLAIPGLEGARHLALIGLDWQAG
ncbi:MAG: 16S rRNA (guanine(527)-N(7))-methyltransferase [Betaproteobacteria bacterium RIFCSPLOWO2_12_FULL_62_13]|nr:MAG: 16S rRNA (guanine(527)-N(7))-methyltransferase [Betaproteobacteria bacterium RIFCSPLOWO2_12_FULL_62_13]